MFKLCRRVEAGVSPDLEMSRFLVETAGFEQIAHVLGGLEFRREQEEPSTLGILKQFVPNHGTAWQYALDTLGRYFEELLAEPAAERLDDGPPAGETLLDLAAAEVPPRIASLAHEWLPRVELLGQRTAEMHAAFASSAADTPGFAPEPFTTFYQRSLFQSMRRLCGQALQLLRSATRDLPAAAQVNAQAVLDSEKNIVACLRSVIDHRIAAGRIRCHGDFDLNRVLYTGRDFVVLDFEGESSRTIGERRLKRTPLADVVCLVRSLHRAAASAFFRHVETVVISPDDVASLRRGAYAWYLWSSARFLKAYLAMASTRGFLPADRGELDLLWRALLMEQMLDELQRDLTDRPKWVEVPLRGILEQLGCHRSPISKLGCAS